MTDKLETYRRGEAPKKDTYRIWPLYGAGLDNLGVDGKPLDSPLPAIGADQLLVRHDACGLCFSDVKVIRLGQQHPRIFKDMQTDPVVLGHEVSVTVVQVGEALREQYRPGDRFIVQAEIFKNGINLSYGYMIRGGLSEYGLMTDTILNGDDGNYLIPVQPGTGYAESALTEPWACVTAAYELKYRGGIKPGGSLWIAGGPEVEDRLYTIGCGFDAESHPAVVCLSNVPPAFATWIKARAAELGVPVVMVDDPAQPRIPAEIAALRTNYDGKPASNHFDDIILLRPTAELIETVSPHLADFGVCALLGDEPLDRPANVDVGRVHYNRWVFVGAMGTDGSRGLPADAGAVDPEAGGTGMVCRCRRADGAHARAAGAAGGRGAQGRYLDRRERLAPARPGRHLPGRGRGERRRVHLPEPAEQGRLRGRAWHALRAARTAPVGLTTSWCSHLSAP